MTETAPTFDELGEESFVSLTTYRKDGTPVPTTVWVGRDGDDLLVTTLGDTGKAKRIRHTSRVDLRPSTRSGKVDEDVPTVAARAEVVDDETSLARTAEVLGAKYGLQFKAFMAAGRVTGKNDRRVAIRISRVG